jgi:hypothetical protein
LGEQVFYNDTWMDPSWPARIEAAQSITTYRINGTVYPRIRYGAERDQWPDGPCHDCGVLKGQYHVELVCDVEECPVCGYQVMGCSCKYEGDANERAGGTTSPADPVD